ncbi:SH3 domain-binding protein 5-like [Mya arenaria]|uniref:SH3 domain-binding protein 5-like n=1 Tax=Mya arenaria TaxID=6604 RepID=UPI0022E57ECF|nr:SH3 domain-binding protein 5-like [Mya arenaria]
MDVCEQTNERPDGSSDEEDDYVDPRIQVELDSLNHASSEINRLENELDEARTKYRSIVSTTSGQMEQIAHDRKKSIQKAREYYKLVTEAKLAQSEALKAARQYQTAVGVCRAARETVALAESRLKQEATGGAATRLTSAWQEALNHGIAKLMEAEAEKTQREQEHRKRASRYSEMTTRIQLLERKFSKSIKKARPYFELKAELDMKLMQQKQNVTDLHAGIKCSKMRYTAALRKLEEISEEIHQARRERLWAKIPRMPAIGADTDSIGSSEFDTHSILFGGSEALDDTETDTDISGVGSCSYFQYDEDENETGDPENEADVPPTDDSGICLEDLENKMDDVFVSERRATVVERSPTQEGDNKDGDGFTVMVNREESVSDEINAKINNSVTVNDVFADKLLLGGEMVNNENNRQDADNNTSEADEVRIAKQERVAGRLQEEDNGVGDVDKTMTEFVQEGDDTSDVDKTMTELVSESGVVSEYSTFTIPNKSEQDVENRNNAQEMGKGGKRKTNSVDTYEGVDLSNVERPSLSGEEN